MLVAGWRLIFLLHAVLYTARLPPCVAQSDIAEIIPMLGPRVEVDVIGVLDRSQGVGQHNFYYFVLPFFESLLQQYAAVHRDFARSSVITFAQDVNAAYDTISDPDAGVSKCELFEAAPALWDRIVFKGDPGVLSGTNINGALQRAIEILNRGRDNRPNVTQVNRHTHHCRIPSIDDDDDDDHHHHHVRLLKQ